MDIKQRVISLAMEAGFSRARIYNKRDSISSSMLVCAMPIGIDDDERVACGFAKIAFFARHHFYREAVCRLQKVSAALRLERGGRKQEYRIFCNSSLNEKELAASCGLGVWGKHNLIITPEAGSLVVLAAMTVPFNLEHDDPSTGDVFPCCDACSHTDPPCAAACPTGALSQEGRIDVSRCIQWYASGHGETVPAPVQKNWGRRFYGCDMCQRACPCNQKPVTAVHTEMGVLERFIDTAAFLALSDKEIKEKFKGSALGFSWLSPAALRRNAHLARAFQPALD